MIKLDNVTFSYDENIILKNINLEIEKNKVTFIIGKNGSGKSTLSYLMNGLIFPSIGTITIDDLTISKKTNNQLIREKIGIVFQNPTNQIIFTKVEDDIRFTLENMHVPSNEIKNRIVDSLSIVGMEKYLDANPYNLSGGQKQRIAIASQLSIKKDYLVFDEATSQIDPTGKKDIYKLLKKLKKDMGIIFITNNIEELIYADDIIIIEKNKVHKYSLTEIINDTSILTKHHFEIPFIFKIAASLGIKDPAYINEKNILEMISK